MATKRKAISKKTRFEVFKRDGFVCQYCGANPNQAPLQVDHIIAVADGGESDMDNYVTACQPCNIGKGATPLANVPQSLQERAAETQEREEQIHAYGAVMEVARERLEADVWRVANALEDGASEGYRRDRFTSIKKFVEALGVHEVLAAAEIARGKIYWSEATVFRYFCGICWNKIRGPREDE